VLVDEEEEGVVRHEAVLGGQRHEAHLGERGGLGALLVHRDGALVLQLGDQNTGDLASAHFLQLLIDSTTFTFTFRAFEAEVWLTQLMETSCSVIPEKSPFSWNKSVRPISLRLPIKS